ncbi:MAG TPA: enoyl-CoA hydratase-related protein, partial [Acidimicrobiales bacterium]|nr:enoyl-CoA hydratase-related protein [Acidimicrobiales bacterium]
MPVHYDAVGGHVVKITIDRPATRNALDLPHFQALAEAWHRFRDDADAWVAVLTGVGRSFLAG